MNAEEALQLLDELNASGAPFDEIDDGLLSSDIDVMSSEEEERLDDDIAGLLGDQEESESDEENDNGYGASDSDSSSSTEELDEFLRGGFAGRRGRGRGRGRGGAGRGARGGGAVRGRGRGGGRGRGRGGLHYNPVGPRDCFSRYHLAHF